MSKVAQGIRWSKRELGTESGMISFLRPTFFAVNYAAFLVDFNVY